MAIEETALKILETKQGFELAFYVVLTMLIAVLYFGYAKLKDIEANYHTLTTLYQNLKQGTDDVCKIALNAIQGLMEKNK